MDINATVLVQLATFAVLVWLMRRLLWEPLARLMAERERRVAAGAAAAERARYDLALADERAEEIRAAARREADQIVAAADRRTAELAAAIRAEADAKAEELRQAARQKIDASIRQVRGRLRFVSGELAACAAARLGLPLRRH